MSTDHTDEPVEKEWENRVLCSDEACIGVIGPDGRCKECGRPYEGDLPLPDDGEGPESPEPGPDETPAPESMEDGDEQSDDEWARRKLCSDEACIGVIGPDGRCKECGRPYES